MIYCGANGLSDLREIVDRTVSHLQHYVDRFDAIVVTGMSGALVGSPVSLALDKRLCLLRKPEDGSHHAADGGTWVGPPERGDRLLFLDDFVSTGETRGRVLQAVEVIARAHARRVGDVAARPAVVLQYMYRDDQVKRPERSGYDWETLSDRRGFSWDLTVEEYDTVPF